MASEWKSSQPASVTRGMDAPVDAPGGAPTPAVERHFDQVERITNRVLRGAAVGVPVWIVLLGLLPFTGLGVAACLLGATAVAVAAMVVAERAHARRAAPPEHAGARGPRRRMSPLAAAAITLGAVLLVVYVIFVLSAG